MDDPTATAAEIAQALRFIRLVNRRLGGTRATLAPLRRWARQWRPGETIRIIDIGTGSADIPAAIVDWAGASDRSVQITAVDLHPVTLELARRFAGGGRAAIEFVHADALRLMERFRPGSFDYAHAGMFLHHLSDEDVVAVLRIMDGLTTRGLIWNDLTRGRIERAAVRLMALGLSAHVRHDATVSVAAGFTREEAMALARRAGLRGVRYRRHLCGRFALTSEKS